MLCVVLGILHGEGAGATCAWVGVNFEFTKMVGLLQALVKSHTRVAQPPPAVLPIFSSPPPITRDSLLAWKPALS